MKEREIPLAVLINLVTGGETIKRGETWLKSLSEIDAFVDNLLGLEPDHHERFNRHRTVIQKLSERADSTARLIKKIKRLSPKFPRTGDHEKDSTRAFRMIRGFCGPQKVRIKTFDN